MEFRILGPLAVSENSVAVSVPGRSTKRLLALLLLDAGRALSISRLVDSFWDDAPPATAKRQIQNHAAALRRRLGTERIEPVGDSYRFNLDRAWVDAVEFADAARTSRELVEAGQQEAALSALRSGLMLWRGYPLTGMSGRAIDSGAARLEDMRLSAIEAKVELELSMGITGTVEAELRQILADHPYRQRAATQLVLALHRDGRTTEALEVFETTRARLADDLGLDPGKDLCDLHAAVLRDGPSLNPPTGPVAHEKPLVPRTPIPRQLPTDPARFVGRAEALATLNKQLSNPHAVRTCVVAGAAGTGKTALAVRWAHRIRSDFPDGQLFINLRGFDPGDPVLVADALGRFLRALQPPGARVPQDLAEAMELYRSLTQDKRLLVILDNAADENQVRPLLPRGSDNFTVVTSRSRLAGLTTIGSAAALGLTPLGMAEAVDVLAEVVGGDRLHTDPESTRRIVQLCDRLPLALRIAAALLANEEALTPRRLADDLDSANRLDLLSIDGDPEATVTVALDHSFTALHTNAKRLLCLLGHIPGDDFSRDLAVTIHRGTDTEQLLAHLESMHLVEQHLPHRFRLHDLVREYAVGRAAKELTEDDSQAVADRFIEWHYGFHQESRPDEETNVLAGCQTFRDHPKLWRLAAAMLQAINTGRRYEGLKNALDQSMANAVRHGDALGEFRVTNLFTAYHWSSGEITDAITSARNAIVLAEKIDAETLATANASLAVTLSNNGQYVEAEPYQRRSLDLAPDSTDWRILFNRRFNLGNIYHHRGKYDNAAEIYFRLAAEVEERDSPHHAMRAGLALARICQVTGTRDEALIAANRAVDIAIRISDRRFETIARIERSRLHRSLTDLKAAMSDLVVAFKQARELQRSVLECDALCELVITCTHAGDHGQAREYAQLLTDHAATESRLAIRADIALALAIMHIGTGEHSAAIRQAMNAVEKNRLATRPLELARSYLALGHAHAGTGNNPAAVEAWREAFNRYTQLGVPEAEQARKLFDNSSP